MSFVLVVLSFTTWWFDRKYTTMNIFHEQGPCWKQSLWKQTFESKDMNRNGFEGRSKVFWKPFSDKLFFLNNATYKFKHTHTHLFTINIFDFMYKMFFLFNVLMKYIFWGIFSFVDFINQCKCRRFNSFQYVKIFLDSWGLFLMIFMISWFCQSKSLGQELILNFCMKRIHKPNRNKIFIFQRL